MFRIHKEFLCETTKADSRLHKLCKIHGGKARNSKFRVEINKQRIGNSNMERSAAYNFSV
jgi:hypothetical protein